MESTFFGLSQELAKQGREQQLDAGVDRMYGAKHPKIVTSNKAALYDVPQKLNKVDYPVSWLSAVETEVWRMKCQSGFQRRVDGRRTELR